MYIYIESTNKECCFKKLHLFGNKKCMLWAKFKLTISQPACTASGHVSRVTRMPRDMSQNLGHGERLEDVICPLQTRPRELQVHLQTGVVQAGGPQPPVDHVNLKIQTTMKVAEPNHFSITWSTSVTWLVFLFSSLGMARLVLVMYNTARMTRQAAMLVPISRDNTKDI